MSSNPYKLAVYIGRFQPFHKQHKQVLLAAHSIADHVLVILGSHGSESTTKNPFSSEERMEIITKSITDDLVKKTSFYAIADHPDDMVWINKVEGVVDSYDFGRQEIVLMANLKDESSYYLSFLNKWDRFGTGFDMTINATDIRQSLLVDKTNDWMDKVDPQAIETINKYANKR